MFAAMQASMTIMCAAVGVMAIVVAVDIWRNWRR